MKQGLLECTSCKVWSELPPEFKETKHFGKCPRCGNPMYLSYGVTPKQLGLREQNKVKAGVMLHRG